MKQLVLDEPLSAGDRSRAQMIKRLRSAGDLMGRSTLASAVQGRLLDLWEGSEVDTVNAVRPASIHVRLGFVRKPNLTDGPPVLPRLVKSKGLQLRLLLLMLFDAQCRNHQGSRSYNVRRVNARPDQVYPPWERLVLTDTMISEDHSAAELRVRQVTEAMRLLDQEGLIRLPRPGAARRRQYNPNSDGSVNWELLCEDREPHPYIVPPERVSLQIPRHFFTNLWVFALTDAELAAYLAIACQRARFPSAHEAKGVYLLATEREERFGLTRTTWRATERLHRFRLIDRARDPRRNFRTGKVGDRDARWRRRQIMPARFTINDAALLSPAIDTIYRIMTNPSDEDQRRREVGSEGLAASY